MPDISLDDTIVAISTAVGVGAIGLVRLSGKDAIRIASEMFRFPKPGRKLTDAKSHTVHYGSVHDEKGNLVDCVLVSVFRNPKSYTTEDMVEIGAHGGPHILKAILNTALCYGARQAEAGEFTRRAFL